MRSIFCYETNRKQSFKVYSELIEIKMSALQAGRYVYAQTFLYKKFMQMNENCPVCGQPMEIEPSFYYGTGYVSYSLAVALSVASFVAWWVLIGFSFHDNRFFWWIGINSILLVVVQPYLMRLSRTIWLSFFVKYDSSLSECNINSELEQKRIRA